MSKAIVANAFTIDVEDYFQVAAFDKAIERKSWDSIPGRVLANTDRVLEGLDTHDVIGTFFILGWIAERYPELVRRIADAGHEIACHGFAHERIYRQTPDVFKEETHRAKSLLEQASGKAVIGYRAASFSITAKSLWALDVLIDEGFQYDSSIFPVHHDNYGIPGAGREPATIFSPRNKALVEFPLNTTSFLGLRLPIGGGGYFRLYPYALTRAGLRGINRKGQPFVFYMHPWEVDPDQPRIAASLASRFRHYNNLDKFESRMHRLLKDFKFTTCKEVLISQGLLVEPHAEEVGPQIE